ncbi:MAG TPA: hypothetical protein VGR43_02235, partial [Dehalococcoidia bacterium]|nr:hypothetical protein [Dehalococcoidia bacterium]
MLLTWRARLISLAVLMALAGLAGGAESVQGASFTVDATHDAVDATPGDGVCADAGGACTLRAAVMETNALAGADEISLPAGTYVLSIAGVGEDASATGDLDITDDLAIVGAGETDTNLDGDALDRVVQIENATIVSMADLSISGGRLENPFFEDIVQVSGGGIFNGDAALFLDRVSLVENEAVYGGAIFNDFFATRGRLALTDTKLSGNRASFGGGISNLGEAIVQNSTFERNESGPGGAIFNSGNAHLRIANSAIRQNSATDGAGIRNGGEGIVERTLIYENTARDFGGGVVNNGKLSVVDSAISRNQGGFGGGLTSDEVVSLTRVTIAENVAKGNEFDNPIDGGGIYMFSGTLLAIDSTISGNRAVEDGGGIANGTSGQSNVTVINSTISGNSAGGVGGGIVNGGG